MILILSTNYQELTTEKVVNWLEKFGANYKRINGESLRLGEFELSISSKNEFNQNFFENIRECVIWFRRWDSFKDSKNMEQTRLGHDVSRFLINESSELYSRMFSMLRNTSNFWIDDINNVFFNKLFVLEIASNIGLKIPSTHIITHKKSLIRLIEKYERVITKTIRNVTSFISTDKFFGIATKEIKYSDLEFLPSKFAPSLVQELIFKKYEIRTFYFFGDFYSMAMFTQSRRESSIDSRYYATEIKNKDRWVPYDLPKTIKERLSRLMAKLNLQHGSIDMIYSTSNEFIFLEINPIGQFGMVSLPCNYNLEKIVAEKLIALDKKT